MKIFTLINPRDNFNIKQSFRYNLKLKKFNAKYESQGVENHYNYHMLSYYRKNNFTTHMKVS
jgi:hypothetical protein